MGLRLCDVLTRSSTSRPNLPQHREILSETLAGGAYLQGEGARTHTDGDLRVTSHLFLRNYKGTVFKINRRIKLAKGMLITS